MNQTFVRVIKRIFDFLSALILFVIISPIFLMICVLVKIKMGSPIFFSQIRSGKGQKPFAMIKFRTMTDKKDEKGHLLPDELRQTKFGNFLRSTSLDELPELLLIIKGDMSVIGPRPLPPQYDEFYTERERKRFEIRGGLLPPDSVGSDAIISWDKQLEYEARYAENLSLKNDFKILIAAVRIVFKRNETDYGSYVRVPLDEERSTWNIIEK